MKIAQTGIVRLSAMDLANHLSCRHLTSLEFQAAHGKLEPPARQDPGLAILRERGIDHERAYLDHLSGQGLSITRVEDEEPTEAALERTYAAMQAGDPVIVQPTLTDGRWFGRADVLRRVDRPSVLGDWSYEVVDTKLAKETRAETILQLCLYSEFMQKLQGGLPEFMHVVIPGRDFEPETYRVLDYLAYYRFVQRQLEQEVDSARSEAATYPDPTLHCDICRWWPVCDRRRHDDDHLCLVAGISKLQTRELQSWGVQSLEQLAELPLPLPYNPRHGAAEGYVRVREQARVQLEGRNRARPVHELLPVEAERGLARLPEPSVGDIFFDIEGDPFAGEGGIEYLFGTVIINDQGQPEYACRWSLNSNDERAVFESFVDFVLDRWARHPDLHVYHFGAYESGALKRLMGRYATREDEIDCMLRAGILIDLHGVVRQSLRASVEQYSLKALEVFYQFQRQMPLQEASGNLHAVERALELAQVDSITAEVRQAVEVYNRDDCEATLALRSWLERLRTELITKGIDIPRPEVKSGDPSQAVDERQQRVQELQGVLLADFSVQPGEMNEEQSVRRLVAYLLEWHRREGKAPWWEYFRLAELSDEELIDEKAAVAGLQFVNRVGGTLRSPVDRYRFPHQDTDIREGDDLHTSNRVALGTVERMDLAASEIDIKKRGAVADAHPGSAFAHKVVGASEQAEALFRLGRWIAEHGVDAEGAYRAARDLLLRRPPRLSDRRLLTLLAEEGDAVAAARQLAANLQGGVLAIQGPPGSGKTYAGARMICELIRARKKVGVTAVSHRVIRNLLEKASSAAEEEGVLIRCVQKVTGKPTNDHPAIREVTGNDEVRTALAGASANLVGGTAWLWAREELFEAVDVLFVDEAGQMSLANVLAVAQSARNLVLLGDPQQLEQPQQGSHPDGTDVSALEHVLNGQNTIPQDLGLFLPETWRLHPAICSFTSEVFYDNRLRPRAGLELQSLTGTAGFDGAGLWYVPVAHEGNQNSAPEEVDSVVGIVEALIKEGAAWIDKEGTTAALTPQDILVVAPYNAHVADLSERLPGLRVGTVDKFQGQEAPVVIYTMATSSPEEAPRGMEFLYSLNRLNVATSRARCACILVASHRLFEPECRTPRQMQLANAFCRYLELADSP